MTTINKIKQQIKQMGVIKTILPYYWNLRQAFIIDYSGDGERQATPTLTGIRPDHIGRYRFASEFIQPSARVLDCACGTGYGAFILATSSPLSQLLAVDQSKLAINFAHKYYSHAKINYRRADIFRSDLPDNYFNCIVALEIIEHVNGSDLLNLLYQKLTPGGKLIISTPNQIAQPFDKQLFPFHIRHYTPAEFYQILVDHGFKVIDQYTQFHYDQETVMPGQEGIFNIAIAQK